MTLKKSINNNISSSHYMEIQIFVILRQNENIFNILNQVNMNCTLPTNLELPYKHKEINKF